MSTAALELWRRNPRLVGLFKCPAWPDLIGSLDRQIPAYIHFPLKVGLGIGDAIDTEKSGPADWQQVEALCALTGTSQVNLHLSPRAAECPEIPTDVLDAGAVALVTERLIRDVAAGVTRFGAERVLVENIYDHGGEYLHHALLPEVIRQVVETTGCGLLLDLSHARLAARCLGMDPFDYVQQLPVRQTREIHITGIQRFDAGWVERLEQAQVASKVVERFKGRLLDHLPMTPADWHFFAWSMEQVHAGAWGTPQTVAFEYGGIDSWWAAITDRDLLASQLAQFGQMIGR